MNHDDQIVDIIDFDDSMQVNRFPLLTNNEDMLLKVGSG